MDDLSKGPEQLKEEVIGAGWCVSCGACVEMCPYIKAEGDRVAVVQACGLSDGNCYKVCPRTFTDYEYLAGAITGGKSDTALGGFREIYQARSPYSEAQKAGQYGGVASALMVSALEEKMVDAALLTGYRGVFPHWTMARNRQAVIGAAGSKYGVCPGLSGLNSALRTGSDVIAVTGRPCQVTAMRKMQLLSLVEGRERVGLILGLFCFWGLDYRFYDDLYKNYGVTKIKKADIPKDAGLTLETDQGNITLSLDETRSYVRRGCHSCIDQTSELADLSIGSTESDPGWCTLIVRTDKGAELFNRAVDASLLETRPASSEALKALREAALTKKRRVLESAGGSGDPVVNSAYLNLSRGDCKRIMGEGA